MAHARRYFEKAMDNDKARAECFLKEIQLLYAIERNAKETNITATQILEIRRQEAIPVLQRCKTWLQENYSQVLIRPVALGRKNFLFAGSNEGGKRLALLLPASQL
jgi:hypothetical protein